MDRREVEIVAELANIELSEEDVGKFSSAVEQMIEYFEIMAEVNVDETASDHQQDCNALRSDRAVPSGITDEILEQAPELEDRFIVIPNVL